MLIDRISGYRVEKHKPVPRIIVSAQTWRSLARELASGGVTLFGLWGDTGQVHMALMEESELVVVTIECPDGKFPSVGALHPPALRLERTIHDLFGFEPLELSDQRPWLDHGRFGASHPLGAHLQTAPVSSHYRFLPTEGEGLHKAQGAGDQGLVFGYAATRRNP